MAKIEIFNNSGYTLINDSFLNMWLHEKGALVFSRDDDDFGWIQDVTYTAKTSSYQPIIAVRCTSHKATVYRTIKSGNNYTFTILFGENDNAQFPSSPVGNYYIFDIQENHIATGNLIVRNQSNNVVFDSDLKYMRVNSIHSFPTFKLNSQPRTEIQTESGRLYAAVCLNYGYYYEYSSAYDDVGKYYDIDIFYMYDAILFKNTSLVNQGNTFASYNYQQQSSGGAGSSQSISGKYMIIDVTGY